MLYGSPYVPHGLGPSCWTIVHACNTALTGQPGARPAAELERVVLIVVVVVVLERGPGDDKRPPARLTKTARAQNWRDSSDTRGQMFTLLSSLLLASHFLLQFSSSRFPLLSSHFLSSPLILSGLVRDQRWGGAFSPDVIAQQPRGLVGDLLWACTGWVSAFAISNGNSIRAESSALSTGWVSAIAIEIGYSTRAEGSA